MHVDFKITTWERINVPEEKEEEVLKLMQSGEIETGADLADYLGGCDIEHLLEVDEYMTPEENGGFSTIELYQNNEMTWQNTKQ